MSIPPQIRGQSYVNLATFRKNGNPVLTPVWFGEQNDKLYVMSQPHSGKCKRIRNNPQVQVAACTMRGRITGPTFSGKARIVSPEETPAARETVRRKYWLARLPFLWSKDNV